MNNFCIRIFISMNLVGFIHAAQILTSPLVSNLGKWGTFERCHSGTKVVAVQVKTEPWNYWNAFTDDTCLNGVKFICGNESTLEPIGGTITSSECGWGRWGHIFACNGHGYAIGFMTRTEEQGTVIVDESAINNLRILCAGSLDGFIELDGEEWGEWTNPRICDSHEYICGLQTQVEEPQGIFGDDTALNNIRVECCDLSEQDLQLYGVLSVVRNSNSKR